MANSMKLRKQAQNDEASSHIDAYRSFHLLVNELRLLTYPLVLGRGKRLFGTDAAPAAFQLVASKVSPNGAVIATSTRAGEVKTGSFAMEQPTAAEIERRRNMK